jgi:hypothetical protein
MGLFDGPKDKLSGKFQQALDTINKVYVPTTDEQKVQLEQLVQQGIITPEEMQTFLQNPTELNQISVDPRFREAQTNALTKMQDIVNSGGLTAIDKARIQDIIDTQNTEERGQREAIDQNARERGIGGSDFSLVSKAVANQGSANRAARSGMDVAALAEQRALDAIKESAAMGSNLENTEYGQQADKAKAQDIINQFNTANKQAVGNANVNARNSAQQLNLGEKQRVSDVNTGNENANRVRNADLIHQKFQDEMSKAGAASNILGQWGTSAQDIANKKYASQVGLIGTGAQIGAGLAMGPWGAAAAPAASTAAANTVRAANTNPLNLDPNRYMLPSDVMNKEDIHPADTDLDTFMTTLQPYKYKYKDPSMGEGEHTGVMANDMAKSPVGAKIVVSTPKGLAIDTNKGFGVLAAAIGRLNKKLEESKNGL